MFLPGCSKNMIRINPIYMFFTKKHVYPEFMRYTINELFYDKICAVQARKSYLMAIGAATYSSPYL